MSTLSDFLCLPGVAVNGQIVGSVVQSVFLDETNIWETVSVDDARLTTLWAQIHIPLL